MPIQKKTSAKSKSGKATKSQKDEVLFETKQINALKLKRNSYQPGSKYKKALQSIIDVAEKSLKAKRAKYGI